MWERTKGDRTKDAKAFIRDVLDATQYIEDIKHDCEKATLTLLKLANTLEGNRRTLKKFEDARQDTVVKFYTPNSLRTEFDLNASTAVRETDEFIQRRALTAEATRE